MKPLNIVINAVLFLAVIVLYIFHFTSFKGDGISESIPDSLLRESSDESVITYVNIDTLLLKMNMYQDFQEELAKKQTQLETSFASEYKKFEQTATKFQDEVSKGLLTRSEMQEKDQQLGNERLRLENLQNEYMNQIQEQGVVGQRKVIDYIMTYLKEYNLEKGYQYIFSFSFGGNLLYVNDELDITEEVLQGINNKYNIEKAGKK